jgi:hypothetical protein
MGRKKGMKLRNLESVFGESARKLDKRQLPLWRDVGLQVY